MGNYISPACRITKIPWWGIGLTSPYRIPCSGSFIRPSASISYGISFLSALFAKYSESLHGSSLEKVVLGSSNGSIEVEAPGLDRVRNNLSRLERLREVSLDGEGVATADTPGSVRRTCPGKYDRIVVKLRPYCHRPLSWSVENSSILRVLHSFIYLNWSYNVITLGIRGLDLSKNLLPSWDVIAAITSELPNLQRLALK